MGNIFKQVQIAVKDLFYALDNFEKAYLDHIFKELNLFGLDEILPQLKCLENIIIM